MSEFEFSSEMTPEQVERTAAFARQQGVDVQVVRGQAQVAEHDFVEHLLTCRKVGSVLVGDAGVDMTTVVTRLLAEGWTWGGQEIVDGKRVRYLRKPEHEQIAAIW